MIMAMKWKVCKKWKWNSNVMKKSKAINEMKWKYKVISSNNNHQ